jgi:hypothetical protein
MHLFAIFFQDKSVPNSFGDYHETTDLGLGGFGGPGSSGGEGAEALGLFSAALPVAIAGFLALSISAIFADQEWKSPHTQ